MTDIFIDRDLYDDELAHYGVLHKSGRYPWGSGENPYQRSLGFLQYVDSMRKQGLDDVAIAKGIGIMDPEGNPKGLKTTEFRSLQTIAKNEIKRADLGEALKLQAKGMSNVAIGKAMGKPEATIRAMLKDSNQVRINRLEATADLLRQNVAEKTYLDVGVGTEHHLHISDTLLKVAVVKLREEGYQLFYHKTKQLGTNHETTMKILVPPGVTYGEFLQNKDKIRTIANWSEDGGETYNGSLVKPRAVSSKRIDIRYGDEGGDASDGVIQIRRGVEDLSLGQARYAQVRIAVDKDRYLKGMAMYADDLPDGVDILFNTNKTKAELQADVDKGKAPNVKLAALKKQGEDEVNPFSSMIYQKHYLDANGKEKLSALNIVNEEGKWSEWSNKLSSQFLSKQSPALAKEQLTLRYETKKEQLEEILRLTNPTVRKKLLKTFADASDSSSVHLKAAGLPGTKNHVILPVNSLKDNEIYAPGYDQGQRVVLVRHPHGGIFEIPQLIVNNKNKEARRLIQNAEDAVGINSTVAAQLSGADFDGDTVLVIPNDQGRVKVAPALLELKDFNPRTAYPKYEGMKVMGAEEKQTKMGDISNLITDMTIRGATQAEKARAIKHSMVVIDAEKHELNYKQSYKDQNIAELKEKYQGPGVRKDSGRGASTLISLSNARTDIPKRGPRPAAEGGPVDLATGKLQFVETGESYVDKNGNTIVKKERTKKGAVTEDAFTLSSGTPIENVYATYSNQMKALANRARKEQYTTKSTPQSKTAKEVYSTEVAELTSALNLALKNAPLERQAQVVANATLKQKIAANPSMDSSDKKKLQGKELEIARHRVGADKARIVISPRQWDAIQAGAVSNNVLEKILNNTDLDKVKELATPRQKVVVTSSKLARARSLLNSGYTQSEVAKFLGISVSTLNEAING